MIPSYSVSRLRISVGRQGGDLFPCSGRKCTRPTVRLGKEGVDALFGGREDKVVQVPRDCFRAGGRGDAVFSLMERL